MIAQIEINSNIYNIDFSKPIDISLPMSAVNKSVSAWYVDQIKVQPVIGNGFVGAVKQGGSVNFRNIMFNPHGNGTHTECAGHITEEVHSINDSLKFFFFKCQVVSITPTLVNKDQIITLDQIKSKFKTDENTQAIVIRTLPNSLTKKEKNYSNTNPPYVQPEVMKYLVDNGVNHFIIDLPSVDKEVDGGELLAHKAFWNFPNVALDRTITELVYVEDNITDGDYFINIQIASFENDASPSKPVLYKIV